MPGFTDAEIAEWLRTDDEETRSARAARARVVAEDPGPEAWRMFPGGTVTATAFIEARVAYVNGLYLACVLLCQVCLEHALAALFVLMGDDETAHARYPKLLRAAVDQRLLSEGEFALFDRLRDVRNPYQHPRPLDDAGHPMRRAITTGTPHDDLLAADATEAITGLLSLMSRPPFLHNG